jgi:hypothetical protein
LPRKLYANEIISGRPYNINTFGLNVAKPMHEDYNFPAMKSSNDPETTHNKIGTGSMRINAGWFVGMSAHCETNMLTDDLTMTFWKKQITGTGPSDWTQMDGAPVTLGTLVIPAGETGCFFSDPDALSRASRAWEPRDHIGFRLSIPSGASGEYIGELAFTIGIEADNFTQYT